MKTMKFFAVASLALAAAACSNDEVPVANNEAQALTIRFEQPKLASRAIEAPVGAGTEATFTDVTLQFWGATGKKQSKGTIVLSSTQITAAKTADGTQVTMPAGTVEVSMIANIAKQNKTVQEIQGLGATTQAFAGSVPMTSPAVAPVNHPTVSGAKLVNLVPVPDLARIEVFGKITPKKVTVNGQDKSAYKSVTVETVYINNYYENTTATALKAYKAGDAIWSNYVVELTDAITDANRSDFEGKTKAAAYQLFPASGADNMPHVIVKLSYELEDGSKVTDRYITIRKYKNGAADFTALAAGKIYKLDLAGLNDYFKTNSDGSQGDDPTDNTPEAENTDLYVTIQTYEWEAINLTPVLP